MRLAECFCGCRPVRGSWREAGREVEDIFSPLVKALYCPPPPTHLFFPHFLRPPISAYRNQKKWESVRACCSGGGGEERVQTKPLAFLISRLAFSAPAADEAERMPPAGSLRRVRRHLINIKRRPRHLSVIIVVYLFYIPLVVFTAARAAAPVMRR